MDAPVWMSESQARAIDALCKLIATLGLVIGGGWSLITYMLGRKDQAKTAAIEAKKPFNEKRLERYIEAVLSASIIATGSPGEIENARRRFWNLYWGELALFEDEPVENAMVRFGKALAANGDAEELKALSLELAHACRNSLAESWSVDLSKSPVDLKFRSVNYTPS